MKLRFILFLLVLTPMLSGCGLFKGGKGDDGARNNAGNLGAERCDREQQHVQGVVKHGVQRTNRAEDDLPLGKFHTQF